MLPQAAPSACRAPYRLFCFSAKLYQLPAKDVRKFNVRKIKSLHGSCSQVFLQAIFCLNQKDKALCMVSSAESPGWFAHQALLWKCIRTHKHRQHPREQSSLFASFPGIPAGGTAGSLGSLTPAQPSAHCKLSRSFPHSPVINSRLNEQYAHVLSAALRTPSAHSPAAVPHGSSPSAASFLPQRF